MNVTGGIDRDRPLQTPVADGWERLGPYRGQTYYGLPAVKPSYYGWYIVFYFFVGGLASASQFLATVISFLGRPEDRDLVRVGRYTALIGALVSPPLLIADLHSPGRWYNMLRIFRRTSPMSIGSWALTAFGLSSGFTAVGQFVSDLLGWRIGEWFAKAASLPAAAAGWVVAIYTGTLLAATSTPLWASAYPLLSSLFAASAASTASALLTLAVRQRSRAVGRGLAWFSAICAALELLLALGVGSNIARKRSAPAFQKKPPFGRVTFWTIFAGAVGLGVAAPLAIHALELTRAGKSGKVRRWAITASILTLVGGVLLRAVFIFGGNASVRRPEAYFRLAQPTYRKRTRLSKRGILR